MKGMTKENIVIDTNCLEDARKSSLLDSIFNLQSSIFHIHTRFRTQYSKRNCRSFLKSNG